MWKGKFRETDILNQTDFSPNEDDAITNPTIHLFKKWLEHATRIEQQKIWDRPDLTKQQKQKIVNLLLEAGGYNNKFGLHNLLFRIGCFEPYFDVLKYNRFSVQPYRIATLEEIDLYKKNWRPIDILYHYGLPGFLRHHNRKDTNRIKWDLTNIINIGYHSARPIYNASVGIKYYQQTDACTAYYPGRIKGKWKMIQKEIYDECFVPVLTNLGKINQLKSCGQLSPQLLSRMIKRCSIERDRHKRNRNTAQSELENMNQVLIFLKELSIEKGFASESEMGLFAHIKIKHKKKPHKPMPRNETGEIDLNKLKKDSENREEL